MVKAMMASIGLDPARFGAHSLRIGGATAALAAGLSPAAIRAAGRWASDVYMLNTRCNMKASQRLATVIGSTRRSKTYSTVCTSRTRSCCSSRTRCPSAG